MLSFVAIFIVITRWSTRGRPVDEFKVIAPPPMNTMEQLLAVQNAISQAEELIQDGNVVLLKLRGLLLSIFPQVPWFIDDINFDNRLFVKYLQPQWINGYGSNIVQVNICTESLLVFLKMSGKWSICSCSSDCCGFCGFCTHAICDSSCFLGGIHKILAYEEIKHRKMESEIERVVV